MQWNSAKQRKERGVVKLINVLGWIVGFLALLAAIDFGFLAVRTPAFWAVCVSAVIFAIGVIPLSRKFIPALSKIWVTIITIVFSIVLAVVGLSLAETRVTGNVPNREEVVSTSSDANYQTSVKEYLAGCSTYKDANSELYCLRVLIFAEPAAKASKGGAVCVPEDLTTKDLKAAVIGWLQGHPELSEKEFSDGMGSALASLYPCH